MMAGHLSKNRVGSLAFSCFFKKVFGLCIEVHERSFLILSERWMDWSSLKGDEVSDWKFV